MKGNFAGNKCYNKGLFLLFFINVYILLLFEFKLGTIMGISTLRARLQLSCVSRLELHPKDIAVKFG